MSNVKADEQAVLDSLCASHPNFEGVTAWQRGNDPPDFVGVRANGEKVGLELTELLDSKRATSSISRTDAKYQWLEALATEQRSAPKSFDRVVLEFKRSVKFNPHHATKFCEEFYALVEDADQKIDRASLPQSMLNVSGYPKLGRYVSRAFFESLPERYRPSSGQRWVGTGGELHAVDLKRAARSFLKTVQRKTSKENYKGLAEREDLKELILVVHFGIRGFFHFDPGIAVARPVSFVDAARSELAGYADPFSKVYFYLQFNDGPLHLILP